MLNRIVGQVAVTGKHQWIFSDKLTTNSSSSFEVIIPKNGLSSITAPIFAFFLSYSRFLVDFQYCDGWQAQFSAGIKVIFFLSIIYVICYDE